MKRYRIVNFDFDTRAILLAQDIPDHWEPAVRQLHLSNRESVLQSIRVEFGEADFERKTKDFVALGAAPFSVLGFHNSFFRQVRYAFIAGNYYPALTGACALGERILNHLVLSLREDFKATPEYKRVYGKSSFDNWTTAIDVLSAWGVFRSEVIPLYRHLSDCRNAAVHFRPDLDSDARTPAFKAIELLSRVIDLQFGTWGTHPWLLIAPGVPFIRKDWEANPFIRRIYLPNCAYVGPRHRLEGPIDAMRVVDPGPYENVEITDEAFVQALASA